MPMDERDTRLSRALSHMLRHRPEHYGLELDAAGWAPVDAVLAALGTHDGRLDGLTVTDLRRMMAAAEKQRFELRDGRMRAVYGHSLKGRIAHEPATPPAILYHGTTWAALPSIRQQGLRPMRRQLVHLSPDTETATIVARRRTDDPAIIEIDAGRAYADGTVFYATNDRVWLAEAVAPKYLRIPDR